MIWRQRRRPALVWTSIGLRRTFANERNLDRRASWRGAAIPHALLPDLQRPFGLMAKLKQPIEFDAIDSQAVDLVFLLLLPERTDNGQLSALALVARLLRRIDVLDRLRSARDTAGIWSVMAEASRT